MGKRGYNTIAVMITGTPLPATSWIIRTKLDTTKRDGRPRVEYTLSQALHKGNNLAFHLTQSFEPGEVDYQKAHEIGKQLADAVTKGQRLPEKDCPACAGQVNGCAGRM